MAVARRAIAEMSEYESVYRLMTNEELLNLAKDSKALCAEAQVAFNSELVKRGLGPQEIEEQAECVRRGRIEDARQKPVAQTFNGLGTGLYGKRNIEPDGSFVTTIWVVLLWIPLIPLKSLRVKYVGESTILMGWSQSYVVLNESRPDIRQVINIYSFMASFFVGFEILDLIHATPWVGYAALLLWVCTPWAIRRVATSTR